MRPQRSGFPFPVSAGGPLLLPLAVALLYAVVGAASFVLLNDTGWVAPVWPAAGIAFAAVMAGGAPMVPGVALGSLLLGVPIYRLAGLPTLQALGVALVIAFVVALQAQAGAVGVRRILGSQPLLDRSEEILPFVLIGGPAACLIGSTVGTFTLLNAGLLEPLQADRTWLTWWVGDSIGVFVFAPLTLMLLPSEAGLWRGRRLTVALPSLIVLALSLAIHLLAAQIDSRTWNLRLQGRGSIAIDALQRGMQVHEEVLEALRSVIEISGPLTPEAFHRFTAGSLRRHSGLYALSWNPLVAGQNLSAFEREWARHLGLNAFRVTERGPDGRLRPVHPRPHHVPVAAIEPFAANRAALGFDIATDPTRADALDRAIASGAIQATAPIRLVQESGDQQGVLLVLPMGVPAEGFAVGVVRCRDLLAETFIDRSWESFHIRLIDRTPGEPERELARLFRTPSPSSSSRLLPTSPPVQRHSFVEAGRIWDLELQPTLEFLQREGPTRSPALLLVGLAVSGLMESFLLLITGVDRQSRRELQQKLRTSLTASAVAHEIKQPLTTMLLRARLLEAGLQREAPDAFIDSERRHLLDTAAAIGRDARAVSRTIDRIRDILGNVVSQLAPLDIADPIRGALLVLRAELVRQGITVQCEGLDPPHWINGDREQLQLVMLNLIRNAVEASGPGGTVAIAVRSLLRRVEVEVADDGPGFDPAITDLEQVLLATTKPGGTGIGLYLVRCTMDNHRGLVRLRRSSLGGGSVVLEFRSARTRGDMAPGSLQ